MNNYDHSNYGYSSSSVGVVDSVMKKVYVKMTLALIVSAIAALWGAANYGIFASGVVRWGLIIGEFALVFGISGAINRLSAGTATALFYLFAVVNGLMLSSIFLVYSMAAIIKTFFITAATFGAMSVYGYFTSKDLSRMGSFLFMALIGLVIASLVNFFLRSSGLDWIISIVGVLIFIGLTAWDTQQIKNMAQSMYGASANKLATLGALTLYLDFINLFIYLLRIFGGNRD